MIRLLPFFPTRWWSPKAWTTWRRYIHWRLETYGVYYPNGTSNRSMLYSLLRQFPSYYHWLGQIQKLRK